jgi:protein translocase SecG subunit
MKNILFYVQIVLSVSLVAVILIQSRGTGFSRGFGSTSSFTRRGLEKIVFRLTFVLAALFIVVSTLQVIL